MYDCSGKDLYSPWMAPNRVIKSLYSLSLSLSISVVDEFCFRVMNVNYNRSSLGLYYLTAKHIRTHSALGYFSESRFPWCVSAAAAASRVVNAQIYPLHAHVAQRSIVRNNNNNIRFWRFLIPSWGVFLSLFLTLLVDVMLLLLLLLLLIPLQTFLYRHTE